MDKKILIATHDGLFHSDDVFAVATLFCVLETALVVPNVLRTRDEHEIRKADFVVDVGSVYNTEANRFDHHQEGGAGKRENGIPYASFGLVWKKFGVKIAGTEKAALRVERNLVMPIDAGDSGVDVYKSIIDSISPYLVEDFVHNLRPTWQESFNNLDDKFMEAVAFAKQVLLREVAHVRASIDAEGKVLEAYASAEDKRLIVLDAFYPHETLLSGFPEPLFVVFPRPDGSWNVKAVRNDTSSFTNRKDLPREWAGKRDVDFASISGVLDATFCHTGLFMAVARSKEGAIKLAQLALAF